MFTNKPHGVSSQEYTILFESRNMFGEVSIDEITYINLIRSNKISGSTGTSICCKTLKPHNVNIDREFNIIDKEFRTKLIGAVKLNSDQIYYIKSLTISNRQKQSIVEKISNFSLYNNINSTVSSSTAIPDFSVVSEIITLSLEENISSDRCTSLPKYQTNMMEVSRNQHIYFTLKNMAKELGAVHIVKKIEVATNIAQEAKELVLEVAENLGEVKFDLRSEIQDRELDSTYFSKEMKQIGSDLEEAKNDNLKQAENKHNLNIIVEENAESLATHNTHSQAI